MKMAIRVHEELFLSTLPARGATVPIWAFLRDTAISIHAPREGSDAEIEQRKKDSIISIHAPREGSDT